MIYFSALHDSDKVYILLPGNPGISELYYEFLVQFHEKYDKSIHLYAIDYMGHTIGAKALFLLEDQIEHARRLIIRIKMNHPNATITLMGHSLGGFIALRLESMAHHLILLFPAIDDLKSTQNATNRLNRVLFTPIGILCITILVYMTSVLPYIIKYKLIHYIEPRASHDQLVILTRHWDYKLVKNTVGLTMDEYKHIGPLDLSKFQRQRHDSVQTSLNCKSNSKLIDKCLFLFTPFDGWCSISTFRQLSYTYPYKLINRDKLTSYNKSGIYLTPNNIPHAFVLGYSQQVCDIVHQLHQ